MNTLVELCNIVSKNKVKSIKILDHKVRSDILFDFYDRILKGELKSDHEASDFFYKESPSHYKYRKLKNRLRERLYNTLFFIDTSSSKFNDHQKAFYHCQKNLITVKLLIARAGRTSAIELLKKTIPHAKRYELTEILLDLYVLLRNYYAIANLNRKLYEKASLMVEKYQMIRTAELKCEELFHDIAIDIAERKKSQEDLVKKSVIYGNITDDLAAEVDSFGFLLVYFFMQIQRTKIENNFLARIEVCNNAIRKFSQKPFVSDQFIGAFHYHKLIAHIQLQNYDLAEQVAERCLNVFQMGSVRWFNTQEYYFTLCMHIKKYDEAFRVLRSVRQNRYFKYRLQHKEEIWRLKEAYVFYLFKLNKLDPYSGTAIRKFRLQRFLNQVPTFSMNKRVENVPILLIQILILIVNKYYDRLMIRIEAIEKYSSRYLRKDENFRSNCFIKMLLEIPKRNFHRVAVERHARKYVDRLGSVPLKIAEQPAAIEIIPYEHLWEYTLESLDRKVSK